MRTYYNDKSAYYGTVSGWISYHGKFFGTEEDEARLDGCTHKPCKGCGVNILKKNTDCKKCHLKQLKKDYNNMAICPWNETIPLYSLTQNEFYSKEQIEIYKGRNLLLVICERVYLQPLSIEDHKFISYEFHKILDQINELIDQLPAVSYKPINYRPNVAFYKNSYAI